MVIKGNALEIVALTGGILFHQVNCRRVAGAGIARQIRYRWPKWYDDYNAHIGRLGDALLTPVDAGAWIMSLYAQYGYGRDRIHTNYNAFASALEASQRLIQGQGEVFGSMPVYFPYGIGCGLAGGDWSIIEPMIYAAYPGATIVRFG